jgi:uncharacterized protein (TIGR02453 family)
MIEKAYGPFTGFTPDTLEFLRALAANNSRDWFEAHKDQYRLFLQEPLRELAAALVGPLMAIDPDLIVEPRRVVSRIHRDTRFSLNKSPYKTTMWLTFKRPLSQWQDAPSFFFEMGAETWRYGMGFYSASKETMDRLRRQIERKPAAFKRTVAFLDQQERFVVEGEMYKRLINPAVPADLRNWHQRKSVYLVCNRQSDQQLFGKSLVNELVTGFNLLEPLYHTFGKLRI